MDRCANYSGVPILTDVQFGNYLSSILNKKKSNSAVLTFQFSLHEVEFINVAGKDGHFYLCFSIGGYARNFLVKKGNGTTRLRSVGKSGIVLKSQAFKSIRGFANKVDPEFNDISWRGTKEELSDESFRIDLWRRSNLGTRFLVAYKELSLTSLANGNVFQDILLETPSVVTESSPEIYRVLFEVRSMIEC